MGRTARRTYDTGDRMTPKEMAQALGVELDDSRDPSTWALLSEQLPAMSHWRIHGRSLLGCAQLRGPERASGEYFL